MFKASKKTEKKKGGTSHLPNAPRLKKTESVVSFWRGGTILFFFSICC